MKNLFAILTAGMMSTASLAQSSDSSSYYFNQGMEEKNARRFREAEKNFDKAFQFDPKNLENLLQLANVLVEQHRYAEAKEKYQKAEVINPNHPQVIENMATLSFNMHKWEDALRYSQRMQQMKIGTGINFMIARCYYELENYGECIKYCELAFKEDPKNPQIPYIAGRSYLDMNNYKKAAGCYEQALAMDSTNASWMYEAGLVWYAVPNDQKALYWIEKAGDKGYTKSNEYMENLASAYLNAGKHESGIGILLEILKRKPQDPELLFSIGDAFYRKKKYPEAIEYWDKILAFDDKNASALYMIGMAYQKKGETQKGEELCEKAIQMDPSLKKYKDERKMPGGL